MILYYSVLDNIYDMIAGDEDPEFILKYLIYIMEVGMCDGTQIKDRQIKYICKSLLPSIERNREMYDTKIENDILKKYQDNKIAYIIERLEAGETQKQIAAELNISQSEVSKRKNWAIRNNFYREK